MKIEIEAVEGDRAQLYQWDLNRRLILTGFGQDTQAHFGQGDSALVVEAYEDGGVLYADIPNICLQRAGMLYVYIYNSANTRTRTAVAISVWPRPKPEDYVYTETETLTYRELDERIAKLEESGGVDGGYYTPSVDGSGNLTWTASKSDMPAVDGANIKGPKGETGAAGPQGEKGDTGAQGAQGETGPAGADGRDGADGQPGADGAPGADGKSAYQYAVEGGYTGTEAEFSAKLAQEMPEALPNPNALTFTGAVTGSYDGSAAVTVEIPSGGGEDELPIIQQYTIEAEDVNEIKFTELQRLSEFELTVSWDWQTKTGTSGVNFTTSSSNGRDALKLSGALNRSISGAILIQGKPVSKSRMKWIKFFGSFVSYNNSNSGVSTVQSLSNGIERMSLYTTTTTVYFPVGTVVTLRGK